MNKEFNKMPNAKYFKYDEEYNLRPIYNDDVVEVVRCKDCKHLVEIDPDNLYVCDRIDIGMDGEPSFLNPENDFCSYGERRGKDE